MKKSSFLILLLVSITLGAFGQSVTGVVTQEPCNNDGIYSISTSGIPLPITYTYYVNGTSIVHANVSSATDQLTNIEMDNNGYWSCQVTSGSITLWTQNSYTPSFVFSVSGVDALCPSTMGTVSATQNSGSTGPFSYTWTNIQTQATYTGNNASVPLGDYSVEITDQTTGCVLNILDSAINIQQQSNINVGMNTTAASCTNGSATASPSGGVAPYTYQWVDGTTTATISNLTKGYYTLLVTDAQGCYANTGAYIQQNPFISTNTTISNATCTQSDGSAMAFGSGGVGPYTYAWSDGQTTQNAVNLSAGTYYTYMVTDANGCTGQGGASINSTTPINVTYSSTTSLCTAPTGSATLSATGGTTPYTYSWGSISSSNSATLSGVAPGTYSFKVTDAVGCVRSGNVVISPVSSINASAFGSTVICPSTTGSASMNVSGSNPPFSYLWNTGATTPQISNVPLGNYSCEVTDAMGCKKSKGAQIKSKSPVHVGISTTPVTCQYNTDGAATASASGGTAPYTYSYSTGATTPSVTGLAKGGYSVSATDANGCLTSRYFVITNSNTSDDCYCTISGHVYVDGNADCNYDSGENGIENIMIHCSGFGYTFTDANGYYSFRVPSGTYTISEQVNGYYPLSACQSNSQMVSVTAASGCNKVVDIANDVNTIHDIKIVTVNATTPPIPGNNYRQKVIVKNEGTVSESGINMGYEHDDQMPYSNSSFSAMTQSSAATYPNYYSVLTGFPTLNPNNDKVILINFNTPTDIPLGTELTFYDSAAHVGPIETSWLSDYTPWNNVNTYQPIVVSSYDPNYKEVSPRGIGAEGYIPSTTTNFDYTVHFQNEGTYFAQNIYITDQLDDDLDWSTLKPGYSDYSYTTAMSETGLVTFTFAGINLPWKDGYGDELSSGMINYSIQRKSTSNAQGTEFTNTADIFFDYNAPITTNTTVNTIDDGIAGLDEQETIENIGDNLTVHLFPVPAQDHLTVRVNNVENNEEVTFSIINIMGHTVLTKNFELQQGSTSITQDVSNLAKGTYLTRIVFTDGSSIVKKIVLN